MENNQSNQFDIQNTHQHQISDNDSSEWITDQEQTAYYRLSIDNSKKIKDELYKFKPPKSKKIKLLDENGKSYLEDIHAYIKDNFIPFTHIQNQTNDDTPYLSIKDNDFFLKNKPEIGTSLFFEVLDDGKDLNYIGSNNRFYDTTIAKPKKNSISKIKSLNKIYSMSSLTKRQIEKNNIKKDNPKIPINSLSDGKNDLGKVKVNNEGQEKREKYSNQNSHFETDKKFESIFLRKKRRIKRQYFKESTVIEIKKV